MREITFTVLVIVVLVLTCCSLIRGYGERRYMRGLHDASHLQHYVVDSTVIRELDSGRLKAWPTNK